jgi:hypothetical protein
MNKIFLFVVFFTCLFFLTCKGQYNNNEISNLVDINGSTVSSRFKTPTNYTRIKSDNNSFAQYLRNLPLKPYNSFVLYFDKTYKMNNNIYTSVIDMDIDSQNLQQCADAVIRLRAEYLYSKKEYDKIHFNFISDGKPRYFLNYSTGDTSYLKFRKYLKYIFSYANTTSLCDELKPVIIDSMKIGDVFVQKGKPYGHAVIVIDMAVEFKTGKKLFMLAQSYMPAQETQLLVNPLKKELSPWYELNSGKIITPEWIFQPKDLRRFKDD